MLVNSLHDTLQFNSTLRHSVCILFKILRILRKRQITLILRILRKRQITLIAPNRFFGIHTGSSEGTVSLTMSVLVFL